MSDTPATPPPVLIEIRPEGYAVLTLQKDPVNSLDLAMWQALEAALDKLEADPSVNGLIFVSGLKRDVFSAGNDLMELYAPRTSFQRYKEFWVVSNRFLARLYRSRLATISAIKGACPAGGCVISLCCDHRVMSTAGAIGLNEVQLGIAVPKFWALLMAKVVGQKAADKLLLTGKLVQPQEAKQLGLVDEVVSKDQLLPSAEKVMQQLVKLPGNAVALTKQYMRQEFADQWEAYSTNEEPEGAWQLLSHPGTVKVLTGVLQRLSGGKAKL